MNVKETEAEDREACPACVVVSQGVGGGWDVRWAQAEFLAVHMEESVVHTPNM